MYKISLEIETDTISLLSIVFHMFRFINELKLSLSSTATYLYEITLKCVI